MTAQEALDALDRLGMIEEIRPNMGKNYPSLGVQVENEGEKSVFVIILSHRSW